LRNANYDSSNGAGIGFVRPHHAHRRHRPGRPRPSLRIEFTGGNTVAGGIGEARPDERHPPRARQRGLNGRRNPDLGSDTSFVIRRASRTKAAADQAAEEAVGANVRGRSIRSVGAGQYTVVRHRGGTPQGRRELQGKALTPFCQLRRDADLSRGPLRVALRPAAVVATAHDVRDVAFIRDGLESSSWWARCFTVVGYSLNDTIIIFDRVRENLRKYRRQFYEI